MPCGAWKKSVVCYLQSVCRPCKLRLNRVRYPSLCDGRCSSDNESLWFQCSLLWKHPQTLLSFGQQVAKLMSHTIIMVTHCVMGCNDTILFSSLLTASQVLSRLDFSMAGNDSSVITTKYLPLQPLLLTMNEVVHKGNTVPLYSIG